MIIAWILFGIFLVFAATVLVGAPYVPSKERYVHDAFDKLYKLKKTDVLLDIGSGDGVVLREASRRGVKAVGFEINPLLVLLAKWLSRGDAQVEVRLASFWRADFPTDTTVVYVFGESRDIKRMFRRIQSEVNRLERPLHVMSYGFAVPGHKPLRRTDTHFLYRITPLQKHEAQV